MEPDLSDLVSRLLGLLDAPEGRSAKARRAARVIRNAGGYRWVGLYAVGQGEISVIGWDGPSAPTHPRFPISQGLNGRAVASGEPVIVQDVTQDARYLPTLSSTRAEMIMPVRAAAGGAVVGTIDVESDQVNAFTARDRQLLSACAVSLARLWTDTT